MIISLLKKLRNSIISIEVEYNSLSKCVQKLSLSKNSKVLDVGCGYGKNLKLFKELGLNALGVEINKTVVDKIIELGMKCVTVEEFDASNDKFELILMSHVIEHFQPHVLLAFMDSYLDRLNENGHLIIVTPLFSPYFYDDFDHVKPYHPTGIDMVFCSDDAQVQFYSRNKLKCVDIWFRKSQFKLVHRRDLYIPGSLHISMIINTILALVYKISFGKVGRTDGWIGIYRKLSNG